MVGVAVKVTDWFLQIVPVADDAILLLTGKIGFTFNLNPFETVALPKTHAELEVNVQVTLSLFAKLERVKVELVSPDIVVPLSFQAYTGPAPPFDPVAVNVTLDPAHDPVGLELATETVTAAAPALTFIVIVFDVSGLPDLHFSLDTRIALITSALASVVLVYVAPVCEGINVPFFNHW